MAKKIFLTAFITWVIAFTGGIVFAQESISDGVRIGPQEFKDVKLIKIGSSRLKAAFSDENQYDTNIFLTPTDEKSGYINILNPELLLDVPLGIDERHLMQLLYNGQIGRQATYHKQSYVNTELGFNGDFKLPFGYFNVQNIFDKTSDRADTEFTSQVKREENNSAAALGVELNKFAFELGYAHFLENYMDPVYDTLEYDQDVYSSTLYYQLFPKTKALLEYDYGVVDYKHDPTRDGDFDQVRLGLKGRITGKTTGIVKFGYQTRRYDLAGRTGYDGPVAEVGVNTDFSESTNARLKFIRTAIESVDVPNNYYNNNSFNLEVSQKSFHKGRFIVSYQVDQNLYPEAELGFDQKRHDTINTGSLAFEYEIKEWSKAKLGYEYKNDNSNIDGKDYSRNLVTISLSVLL